MKIRSGFVSNSSSSSFIVAFDQEPTREYLKKVLYGNQETIQYEYGDEFFNVDDLVDHIMNNLCEVNPFDLLIERVRHKKWGNDDETDEMVDFYMKHQKFIYECEFADENGRVECQLEHGGTFNAVDHKRFSHH